MIHDKAFDKVAHSRLVHKLEYYGVRGKLLIWLESFLNNRTQQVVVEGKFSPPCEVLSGVPQGSVLGPVLFLIYINNISLNIHSELRLFIDDILIYRPIINPVTDHVLLQDDLNTLIEWAMTWQMDFNISKCNILQITMHRNVSNFVYKMRDTPLMKVDKYCYLGVYLQNKLSWTSHIDYILHKVNRLLGFLT